MEVNIFGLTATALFIVRQGNGLCVCLACC
uniref:PsbM n=1 Tax=Borodinellopsis insignis TaxID=3229915 RepID=A0AB39U463_9CHLO